MYRGTILAYVEFESTVFVRDSSKEHGILSLGYRGILLGLNGANVGRGMRITFHPKFVCESSNPDDETNPRAGCLLIGETRQQRVPVRKQQLIVEAVLTESCLPVSFRSRKIGWGYAMDIIIGCQNLDDPRSDPSAPI